MNINRNSYRNYFNLVIIIVFFIVAFFNPIFFQRDYTQGRLSCYPGECLLPEGSQPDVVFCLDVIDETNEDFICFKSLFQKALPIYVIEKSSIIPGLLFYSYFTVFVNYPELELVVSSQQLVDIPPPISSIL